MRSIGITAAQALLLAHAGMSMARQARTCNVEPEQPKSRQVRRAEERAGITHHLIAAAQDPYFESRAVRFDQRMDRSHPVNPKRRR